MMSNWKKMPVHPLAAMFPRPTEMEHVALVQDMKERGYDKDNPIYTVDGAIIDGISRRDAAIEAGVEPTFKEHKSNDLLGFVIARNLHRRHLSTSQRQMLAADIATVLSSPIQGANLPLTQKQAAEAVNVSERGVKDAAAVSRDAAPETVEAVRNGTISTHDAKQIKDEKPAVQRAAVKDVQAGKANTAAEAAAKRQPILCARCTRIGTATKGCEACKDARKAASKPRDPAEDDPAREPGIDAPEEPVKDAVGHVVPAPLIGAFVADFDKAVSLCQQLQALVDVLACGVGGEQLARFVSPKRSGEKTIQRSKHLDDLKADIKGTRPYAVCPYCVGKATKTCKGCNGTGWVTKRTWDGATDAEKARVA